MVHAVKIKSKLEDAIYLMEIEAEMAHTGDRKRDEKSWDKKISVVKDVIGDLDTEND